MARLGVIGAIPADAGQGFVRRYLSQQVGQHGGISHAVVGHFDGPYLQGLRIDAQMHLAPLPTVLGTVLFALPFIFAQELDAGAVHQQVQRAGAGSVGQLHPQRLLAPTHGAVVGHPPAQVCHAQQALHKAQALAQCQAEQALDAQTKLDGSFREDVLVPSFDTGRCVPLHVFVQPDRQRPSGFERYVVRRPVGGLVAGLGPLLFIHASRLPAQRARFVQQSPFEPAGQ